uniref:Uncharacterized protein n=1 Tax=Anguilla anguilla TaxID=7936 RepID=A0A0E9SIA6_ANGAN
MCVRELKESKYVCLKIGRYFTQGNGHTCQLLDGFRLGRPTSCTNIINHII